MGLLRFALVDEGQHRAPHTRRRNPNVIRGSALEVVIRAPYVRPSWASVCVPATGAFCLGTTLVMLAVLGILLTMVGVIVGISVPRIAGSWGGPDTARREAQLAKRYYSSVALIVVGAAFQIPAAWPVGGIGMQQWAVQVLGLAFDLVGVILLVVEWTKAFAAQGRQLAWAELRLLISELYEMLGRQPEDEAAQRGALMVKMLRVVQRIGKQGQLVHTAATDIVNLARGLVLTDNRKRTDIGKALEAGPGYDAELSHPTRKWWVWGGTALIALGFLLQAIGSWPNGVAWLGVCPTNTTQGWSISCR